MKLIKVDFYDSYQKRRNSFGAAILILGLISALWTGVLLSGYQNDLRKLESSIATREHIEQDQKMQLASSKDLEAEYNSVALVVDRLSFPWGRLFHSIEDNTRENVALLSVRPDLVARRIVLSAEAKDWDSMVAYVRRLNRDSYFSEVHLTSHQILLSEQQQPIRFVLSCVWDSNPANSATTSTGTTP